MKTKTKMRGFASAGTCLFLTAFILVTKKARKSNPSKAGQGYMCATGAGE
jgi:hypothetical protein